MKPPQWLAQKIADAGSRQLGGKLAAAAAEAEIIAATREHPEFGEERAATAALSAYRKWVRGHTTGGDLFQAQMLHGLPESMHVTPTRSKPVASMTAEDLDHARNMIRARTANAIKGARETAMAERRAFEEFYRLVKPHLTGNLTVADVVGRVALEAVEPETEQAQPEWLASALNGMDPADLGAELMRHPEFMRGLADEIGVQLHDGKTLAEAIAAAAEKAA